MKTVSLSLLLLAVTTLGALAETPFIALGSEGQMKWTGDTQLRLTKCMEDYRAILEGDRPRHAVSDKKHAVPADGGTSYWIGEGYRITIVQSLCTVGGVRGFMYGPVIKLDESLAVGNSNEIAAVSFYTFEAWRALKDKSRVN